MRRGLVAVGQDGCSQSGWRPDHPRTCGETRRTLDQRRWADGAARSRRIVAFALSAADCRPALERLCQEDMALVEIDLANLRVIDGVGVRLLFDIYKRLSGGNCDLVLQAVGGQPREIFRLTCLDRLIIEAD